MVAKNNPNEICLTRIYDAPVQAVWDAFTDPNQVAQWWGPRGFTLTTHSKDLRPGGQWRYTMHGPDGTDYENVTLYHEVVECQKLVYDHGGSDDRPALFHVTVLFSEVDGKTRMEMTMAMKTAEEVKAIQKIIKEANGNSTWDRLAEYLDQTVQKECSFVINRSFHSSLNVVFQMWSDPNHFTNWLPPQGFEMQIDKFDFRAGGCCVFRMKNQAGFSLSGRLNYLKIVKPDGTSPAYIQYEQWFCDDAGNPSRHPGSPDFPEKLLTKICLVAEPENDPEGNSCRVTVHSVPQQATASEIAAFEAERAGMNAGWTGSFDNLEERLKSAAISVS